MKLIDDDDKSCLFILFFCQTICIAENDFYIKEEYFPFLLTRWFMLFDQFLSSDDALFKGAHRK